MNYKLGYSFGRGLTVGEKGYQEVEQILKSLPMTHDVVDLQDDKEYQKKDVDFIWKINNNGKIGDVLCELKTDMWTHKTGNLFLETDSCLEKGTKGCFIYSACDWFLYYIYETKELVMLPMKRFREWVLSNEHRWATRLAKSSEGVMGLTYHSRGFLVPLEVVREEFECMYQVKGMKKAS